MSNNTRNYILTYNQLLKECDTIYHTAAVNSGLSDCAFWILYTVQDTEHIYTQSEICDNSSLPRQTVNSALKKLEKDGYLTLQRIEGKISKSSDEAGTGLCTEIYCSCYGRGGTGLRTVL
jgi:DNA-binding transcriptional ArsR family regulator